MRPFPCISEAMAWCICNVHWSRGEAVACVLIGRANGKWRYTHRGGFYTLREEDLPDDEA